MEGRVGRRGALRLSGSLPLGLTGKMSEGEREREGASPSSPSAGSEGKEDGPSDGIELVLDSLEVRARNAFR